MDENRIMEVTDEKGNVKKMTILFTTKLENDEHNYVFYFDQEDPEGNVFVNTFDEDGHLFQIEEDDDKWQQLEEVFNAFIEESKCDHCKKDKEGNCDCNDSNKNCCCDKE